MQITTWKARQTLFLAAGLLVLAAICSDGRHALAQVRDPCPLPPGVTLPPDPPVTARQVIDDASLMAFAIAVRDQYVESTATTNQALHLGCLIRQDGTPWRSGSTYVVLVTPTGTVFIHAKDMALSGRKLRPSIHRAILDALGVDLANPAGILPALTAATAESGGPFNVPDVPGASGYAAPYIAGLLQRPMIALAGFDLDETHVLEEEIDHDFVPTVTASDVVDRETLKSFVTQAGEFYIGVQESGDPAAFPKARSAMRDPNGPWRHGSVYLYVLDLTSNIIRVHGAFPNRYEFNYLVPIARDAITGLLVLPQVLEAAASSPEGGFLAYHFDDPTDPNDSADTPKLGYAREFTSEIVGADGSRRQARFVVGSGVYLTYDADLAVRILERLRDGEGQSAMMFGIDTPLHGNTVAGDAVAVSVAGVPSEAVHFAYRPADPPDAAFAYLGAAFNGAHGARYAWDTGELTDGDYELVALYRQDEDDTVIYDSIEVTVDNDAETPDILENRDHKTQALRGDMSPVVVTADGVEVRVPSGVLAGDDRIMIDVVGRPDPATVPGVGTVDVALASGQDTFRKVVTVSLPYSEAVLRELDVAEAGLSIWYFDTETDAWVLLPGPMPDAGRVVAGATQTGEFRIFDAPLLRVEQDGEAVTHLDFGARATVLNFTAVDGNDDVERLSWEVASAESSWLSVSDAGNMVTVSVDRAGLAPGDYVGTLSTTFDGGSRALLPVMMRVQRGGDGGCAALPVLPGEPLDPTLTVLVGLLMVYLTFGQRRLMCQAALR